MQFIQAVLSGFVAASVSVAAISGKVTDTSGNAVSGAAVKLERGGGTATTGPDGKFTVNVAGIGYHAGQVSMREARATIEGGLLRVHVETRSAVRITAVDLDGRMLSSTRRLLDGGTHSLALPRRGAGVYLLDVETGDARSLLKVTGVNGELRASRSPDRNYSASGAPATRAKAAGRFDDVLSVTKDGLLRYRVTVKNQDTGKLEIRMIPSAGSVTDADGNAYQAVKLGSRLWTVENLRTTKYNDGTAIDLQMSEESWGSAAGGAFCYHENNTSADSIARNGALYNWYAVDTKKLAPAGWHVPTKADWETMQTFLIANGYNWDSSKTENKLAVSLAAKADWVNINCNPGELAYDLTVNNRSGFAALPGGYRTSDGIFEATGLSCGWWSATQSATAELEAWCHGLESSYFYLRGSDSDKRSGYSVRLVKDSNEDQVNAFTGKWVGFGSNTIIAGGYERHDTMHVDLTINAGNSYLLCRDYMERGSAGSPIPDSIREEGTWSKFGADSLLLTPTPGKCTRWNSDEAMMMPGEPNPPVRIKIAISGTTWPMNMQNIKDPDTSTAVLLLKQ